MMPVFDGHNDTLLRLYQHPDRNFGARMEVGHIDAVRAREGGMAGGMFAMFTPSPDGPMAAPTVRRDDVPPFGPIDPDHALRTTLGMFATLERLATAGSVRVCRDADQVERAMADGVLAAVPHLEGAEAVVDLDVLEVLHALGLRSLGLVWARPNAYGTGVPFAFPGSPDVGPGLTAEGRALVGACDRLGIVLDVSHLNEAGFWDVLRYSERPVVASHSNAHALCPSPRNLTDAQLDALAERDGLVGVNFACGFLREDGRSEPDTPLGTIVQQLAYLRDRMGEDRVAFGSDFDGATVPLALGDAAGLPRLVEALRDDGWDDAARQKVTHRNWLALWRRVQGG